MKNNLSRRLSDSFLLCPHCSHVLPIQIGTLAGHPLPKTIVADEELIIAIFNSIESTGAGFCRECVLKFSNPTTDLRTYWMENSDRKSVHGPLCENCFLAELGRIGNDQPNRRMLSATTSSLRKLIGIQTNPTVSPIILKKMSHIQTLTEKLSKIEIRKLV